MRSYATSLTLFFFFLKIHQAAKDQWLQDFQKEQSELQAALNKAEESLAEMQNKLEALQRAKDEEIKHLESELSLAWADRDAAAREWTSLSSQLFFILFIFILVGVHCCEHDVDVVFFLLVI